MSGGTKIFVNGVSASCDKIFLEFKFGQFGSVLDIYNTEKGYAFITMKDKNEAEAAIAGLNGSLLLGRPVTNCLQHLNKEGRVCYILIGFIKEKFN